MLTPTRVFISSPLNQGLTPDQLDVKKGILDRIEMVGFEPQEFGVSGDFSQIPWNFDNIQYVLGRCQGSVILGLIRWDVWNAQNKYRFSSVYSSYEGALFPAKNIPTFILMHEHVYPGDVVFQGEGQNKSEGQYIVSLPDKVTSSWLQTDNFLSKFNGWVDSVKNRHHVFFGYSSKAQATANKIKDFLIQKGVSVMDWAVDFKPAFYSLDDFERASKSCMGGIFLFTKDDEIITGDAKSAAPRDNVIFEAGYFMHAKGSDKILIIREESTRLPADIGEYIYVPLQNRDDLSSIEKDLEQFIVKNL